MPLPIAAPTELQISKRINPNCFAAVVVPVKNEAENIGSALRALINQFDSPNRPLAPDSFEIIVLANNCTDDSAEIVRDFQKNNPSFAVHLAEINLPPERANIGYVRRVLMNAADRRLRENKYRGGVILTTDGDTCVAADWIRANLREIENGADAVGGRITIKPEDLRQMNEQARRFHLLDTGYRLLAAEVEARIDWVAHDSLPRHHQHFNGSFAVTTEAFAKAGGIPEVAFLEDVAFYQALLRVDANFRHSPRVRVRTSARAVGRTALGLSTQINEWTIMGLDRREYLVESAASAERRLRARRKLRFLWQQPNEIKRFADAVKILADDLLISAEFLRAALDDQATFGVLYEKVLSEQHRVGEWNAENGLISVERAVRELRLLLEKLRLGN